jgi:hypothetical protein
MIMLPHWKLPADAIPFAAAWHTRHRRQPVIRYGSRRHRQLPRNTVPWLSGSIQWQLIAEPRINTIPVCARLFVDKVALWHAALCAFQLCPATNIPPMRTHSCHRFYIIWAIDSFFNSTRYKKLNKGRCQGDRVLGAFAKLLKATVVMYVRLSDRPSSWNNSTSMDQIFMKFDIWEFFENMSTKIQI